MQHYVKSIKLLLRHETSCLQTLAIEKPLLTKVKFPLQTKLLSATYSYSRSSNGDGSGCPRW